MDFPASLVPSVRAVYTITGGTQSSAESISVNEDDPRILVNKGETKLRISKTSFTLLDSA
jgi:hypothetical protein